MLATAMLFAVLTASASALPLIGKDGKIHACYRVKGKPKGGLRVVPSAKTRCKRGERKVAWITAGSSSGAGQQGSSVTAGGNGTNGSAGSTGAQGSTAALSTQVGTLTLKLEALENVLKGVNNGELTGALGKLNGVSGVDLSGVVDTVKGLDNGDLTGAVDAVKGLDNLELTEAVDKLPAVDLLCTQAADLTDEANMLRGVFTGLGLEGVLGGLLKVPTLPAVLPGFSCPS